MFLNRRQFIHTSLVSLTFSRFLNPNFGFAKEEGTKFGHLIKDQKGKIDLPKGFQYTQISQTGERMDDQLLVPGAPDGMACFQAKNHTIIVRNHELTLNHIHASSDQAKKTISAYTSNHTGFHPDIIYDLAKSGEIQPGGTTTLWIDPKTQKIQRQFLSLAGTVMNCAGGSTPWNSWLSCEETLIKSDSNPKIEHGYVFEVPAFATTPVKPVPLKAMGRFYHEAAVVDPETGYVYLTEDRSGHPCLFYRFIPNKPGQLHLGGRLQALAVSGEPKCDLRNWHTSSIPEKTAFYVHWVDLENITNPDEALAERSIQKKGAAIFSRLEGCWMGKRELYFSSTDGGARKCGQIWRYQPFYKEKINQEFNSSPHTRPDSAHSPHLPKTRTQQDGMLELVIESKGKNEIDFCDNLTLAPWGDLILAEDGAGKNYIKGITQDGKIYPIACIRELYKNSYSEITGICFSPDGKTLYFNVQRPGRTYAVTGAWS